MGPRLSGASGGVGALGAPGVVVCGFAWAQPMACCVYTVRARRCDVAALDFRMASSIFLYRWAFYDDLNRLGTME